jgi:3-oxoacyl-[acyl-carrier protein] reductase
LKNKTLLVTGASSDVGAALIRRIHKEYITIIAHYAKSEKIAAALKNELGDKIVPIKSDFSDENSTKALAKRLINEGFSITHFAHLANAALSVRKFSKLTYTDFQNELNVSFRSAVILLSALLPVMAEKKYGKIVIMLSVNAINQPPVKFAADYTCAKYALLGLMKTLSAEYASKGVSVNGVSPSMIETKFLANTPDLIIQKNAFESPLKRNLTVDDVIPAFEFLLSDASGCVTGQNIAVTGGC